MKNSLKKQRKRSKNRKIRSHSQRRAQHKESKKQVCVSGCPKLCFSIPLV